MKIELKEEWLIITHTTEAMDLRLRVPIPEELIRNVPCPKEGGGRPGLNSSARKVIDYFNEVFQDVKSRKTSPVESHLRIIRARLREGATPEDFKRVFEIKKRDWTGTKLEKYLRISTLATGKFWDYLTESNSSKKPLQIEVDDSQYQF